MNLKNMVENQIIIRGITNKKVIETFLKVPRDKFVPDNLKEEAFNDYPLPIGQGQTISQPYIVALMTEVLNPNKNDKVLEIGTGSGYQTAILAELVNVVYTIERIEALSLKSKSVLSSLGYTNISFKIGDGTLGWEEFSPYTKILVTASSEEVPAPLWEQLEEGGRFVIPLGGRWSQELFAIDKIKGKRKFSSYGGCVFVPLIGAYGYK